MIAWTGLISGDFWEKRPQNLRQEPPLNSGDHCSSDSAPRHHHLQHPLDEVDTRLHHLIPPALPSSMSIPRDLLSLTPQLLLP